MEYSTAEIKLTRGQVTVVDIEDFEKLNVFKWYAKLSEFTNSFYARKTHNVKTSTGFRASTIDMARIIMGAKKGEVVDHINHNTLDNRKSNLRVCTYSQNAMNRRTRKDNKTGVKGVRLLESGRYGARIYVEGRRVHIGTFDTVEEAGLAHDEMARKHFGEFAHTNNK